MFAGFSLIKHSPVYIICCTTKDMSTCGSSCGFSFPMILALQPCQLLLSSRMVLGRPVSWCHCHVGCGAWGLLKGGHQLRWKSVFLHAWLEFEEDKKKVRLWPRNNQFFHPSLLRGAECTSQGGRGWRFFKTRRRLFLPSH